MTHAVEGPLDRQVRRPVDEGTKGQPMQGKEEVRRELTEYGFQFGDALVERCMEVGKGAVVVTVKTTKHKLDVYVTKTGRMRVYFGGLEVLMTK